MELIILRIINKIIRISKKILIDNPLSTKVRMLDYEMHFSKAVGVNLFRGVYKNFQEATDSAPSTKPIGYDHPEPANMYIDRTEQVYSSDYPALFWLSSILKTNCKVFDLGGHVGVSYYAYQQYLNYPAGLQWLICDVPEVTRSGKNLAEKKKDSRLTFTNDYDAVDGYDVLLASGSLQYIEASLADLLNPIQNKPRHIIINLLPVYDGNSFVTLQNIGTAFCPYQIFNKTGLIESLISIGYECIDIWRNEEKECGIPFHPEHSLDVYHGFYFRAAQ
jgi:putative methyltransferase (TIGR04325 family)